MLQFTLGFFFANKIKQNMIYLVLKIMFTMMH